MAKPRASRKSRKAGLNARDVYEAEELVPDEEKDASHRYDVSFTSLFLSTIFEESVKHLMGASFCATTACAA